MHGYTLASLMSIHSNSTLYVGVKINYRAHVHLNKEHVTVFLIDVGPWLSAVNRCPTLVQNIFWEHHRINKQSTGQQQPIFGSADSEVGMHLALKTQADVLLS